MQGSVNEIGVQAKEPNTDMNLSRESPRERQKMIVKRTIMVLLRFFSHILFGDLGIPLNR
jgi:hypothetical protein